MICRFVENIQTKEQRWEGKGGEGEGERRWVGEEKEKEIKGHRRTMRHCKGKKKSTICLVHKEQRREQSSQTVVDTCNISSNKRHVSVHFEKEEKTPDQ